jgi:hypothetical protein
VYGGASTACQVLRVVEGFQQTELQNVLQRQVAAVIDTMFCKKIDAKDIEYVFVSFTHRRIHILLYASP